MDGARASKPRGFDLPIDEIASTFGAAEDDAARAVHDVFLEHRHRAIELLFLFDHFHRLRDGFIRRQSLAAVADAHVRRVRLRERVCDFPNSLGPRRREHQRLTSGGAHLQNLLDLRFESHVQHAVRLVEHHVVRVTRAHGRGEPGGRRQKIVESAGGCHDDIGSGAERAELISLARAAVQRNHLRPRGGAKLRALVTDLNGELAGRGEDDGGRYDGGWSEPAVDHLHLGCGGGPLLDDAAERGEEETARLAAAGLGDGDDVLTGDGDGPGLGLDRGGGGVALLEERLDELLREGGIRKRMMGSTVPGATLMACSSRKAATSSGVGLPSSPGEGVAGAGASSGEPSFPPAASRFAFLAARLAAFRSAAAAAEPAATAASSALCAASSAASSESEPSPLRFFTGRPSLAAMNSSARFAFASAAARCLAAFFAFFTLSAAGMVRIGRANAAPSGSRADPKRPRWSRARLSVERWRRCAVRSAGRRRTSGIIGVPRCCGVGEAAVRTRTMVETGGQTFIHNM